MLKVKLGFLQSLRSIDLNILKKILTLAVYNVQTEKDVFLYKIREAAENSG
jgi:hypothetical protein